MRIVLKTRGMSDALVRKVISQAEKNNLKKVDGEDTTENGFVIVRLPGDQRMLMYFDDADDWPGVIGIRSNFLQEYQDFARFLSSRVEAYFDIGVDNTEVSGSLYHEFVLPPSGRPQQYVGLFVLPLPLEGGGWEGVNGQGIPRKWADKSLWSSTRLLTLLAETGMSFCLTLYQDEAG